MKYSPCLEVILNKLNFSIPYFRMIYCKIFTTKEIFDRTQCSVNKFTKAVTILHLFMTFCSLVCREYQQDRLPLTDPFAAGPWYCPGMVWVLAVGRGQITINTAHCKLPSLYSAVGQLYCVTSPS